MPIAKLLHPMPGTTRQSNADRRRARDNCRLKLSQHISERLGIEVKPSEVRLNPRPHDAYCWKPFPGHDALFSPVFAKSLSDHSIGTYRLLSKQVGKTFEAVLSEVDNGIATIGPSAINSQPSFSAEIERLKCENTSLSQQICQLSSAVEVESEQRKILENDNEQLQNKLQWYDQNWQKYVDAATYFQDLLTRCFEELDKSLPAISELRQQANLNLLQHIAA